MRVSADIEEQGMDVTLHGGEGHQISFNLEFPDLTDAPDICQDTGNLGADRSVGLRHRGGDIHAQGSAVIPEPTKEHQIVHSSAVATA